MRRIKRKNRVWNRVYGMAKKAIFKADKVCNPHRFNIDLTMSNYSMLLPSIEDLRKMPLSEEEKKAMRCKMNALSTEFELLRKNSAGFDLWCSNPTTSFIIAQSGAGQSFFFENLIQQAQKENPSFSKEEATEFAFNRLSKVIS